MSDATEHHVAAPLIDFEELPDAPPKRKLKFTIIGKIAIFIVTFLGNNCNCRPFHFPLPRSGHPR